MRHLPSSIAERVRRTALTLSIAGIVTVVILCPLRGTAQKLPQFQHRWQHIGPDSLYIEYTLPETEQARPAVIVLPDRFGMQAPVSNIVSVFALQGFRTYAIGLRSTPRREVSGSPPVIIDSGDIALLAQAVVDIVNEPGCTGAAGLFAFDAGAVIGALAASRMPLFKSCVFLYPPSSTIISDVIPLIEAPVTIALGDSSSPGVLDAAMNLKEEALGRTWKLKVHVYRDTGPFFFNQKHASFRKESMNAAWVDAIRFFGETL